MNEWTFAYSNPVRYTDPEGTRPISECEIYGVHTDDCKSLTLSNWIDEKKAPPYITWFPTRGISFADIRDYQDKLYRAVNGAQYKVASNWTGLCGLITIAAILDIPVRDLILTDYMQVADRGNPNYLTGGQLASFVNLMYGENWDASYRIGDDYEENAYRLLTDALSSNSYILPLVEIVSGSSLKEVGGKVGITQRVFDGCNGSHGSKICHWVAITGISRQWEQSDPLSEWNWIRIYNPFDNQKEYYRWKNFKEAWFNVTKRFSGVLLSPDPAGAGDE